MKKYARHMTIMVNLRDARRNNAATGLGRDWMSSYDVSFTQSITQPQAWRLLQELVAKGFVARSAHRDWNGGVVKYTLTDEGSKYLHTHFVRATLAMHHLINYKIKKYRKVLKI